MLVRQESQPDDLEPTVIPVAVFSVCNTISNMIWVYIMAQLGLKTVTSVQLSEGVHDKSEG